MPILGVLVEHTGERGVILMYAFLGFAAVLACLVTDLRARRVRAPASRAGARGSSR